MNTMLANPGQDLSNFRDKFNSRVCAVDCDAAVGDTALSTRFEHINMGVAEVFRYQVQNIRGANRTLRHIQSDPADDFLILLPLNLPFEISQLENQTVAKPGDFMFLNTAKPFNSFCGNGRGHLYSELKVKVPGTLLRQKIPHLDQCCAIPVSANEGAGRVMKTLIESMLANGAACSNTQARMLGSMLINAIGIAALDAPELMRSSGSSRELSQARVRLMAQQFIECNLSNPQLDCAMIARHCHVSLRHLQASFESAATTVGASIREMRLQHCMEDLHDPVLRNKPIIQIAMKWGYVGATSFTRAYRERFGKTPSEERQQGLVHSCN